MECSLGGDEGRAIAERVYYNRRMTPADAARLTPEQIVSLAEQLRLLEQRSAELERDLQTERARHHEEVSSLRAMREAQEQKVAELSRQLTWFRRQIFGQRSERRLLELGGAQQLSLGELLEFRDEFPEESETVRAYHRRTSKRPLEGSPEDSGLRFDPSVPVQEIHILNPELDGLVEGADYEIIDTKATYRLAQQPGAYVVLKYVRTVAKLKQNEKIVCAAAPDSPLPKTMADVSLLAGLLIDKFRYHLPLYRLHQRLKDCGVVVSRTTLTNLAKRAIELLSPIYYAQFSSVLQSQVLAMDETWIRAGPSPGGGKMHQGYFWPIYGDQNEVCFPYAPSRAHGVVKEILGEFCGTLVSDGYDAYSRYAERHEKVTHALCWAHTRRKFIKAEAEEPQLSKEALRRIGRLYAIEEQIDERRLAGEKKQMFRAEHALPEVEQFFSWLRMELRTRVLLPTGAFTEAAHYALEREHGLRVFLDNPDVPVDTNHLERTLRPIPMGKKNWLFCSTELGAELIGKIQSLIQTCRLHEVDPYTYLVDVLQRIDTHPVREVHLLTPRLWKENFAAAHLCSDLSRVKNVGN